MNSLDLKSYYKYGKQREMIQMNVYSTIGSETHGEWPNCYVSSSSSM